MGHLEEIKEDHTLTFDPCDDAVFLHNDDAKDHGDRGALVKWTLFTRFRR